MRKLSLILVLVMIFTGIKAQYGTGNQFRIFGNIKGLQNGWVRIKISNQQGSFFTLDSVASKNGEFQLKGRVAIADIAHIEFQGKDKGNSFFIENSDIQILGNIDSVENFRITGSRSQFEYEKVMNEMKVFARLQEECSQKYNDAKQKKDMKTMELYDSISNSVFEHQLKLYKNQYACSEQMHIHNNCSTEYYHRWCSLRKNDPHVSSFLFLFPLHSPKLPDLFL